MSKTLGPIALDRIAKSDHPEVAAAIIVTSGAWFGILNLDHWDLFEF